MSTLKVNSIEASSGSEIDINSTLGTVPSIVVSNLNVTGVVTATSFSGSGANLTGVAATSNISTNAIVNSGITTVAAGSAAAPSITPTGDSNTGIFFPSADTIAFGEGGSEAARIDSSGRLLIGTSSSRNVASGGPSIVQIEGSSFRHLSMVQNSNDGDGVQLTFGKSRGTSAGGTTIVQNNDDIARLRFAGANGSDVVTVAAEIQCSIDGTPGASNDMPGRLVFTTTADGAGVPTEAMRINNQRELLIGTTTRTANGGVLQVSNGITFPATQSACSDSNTLDDYEEGTWTPTLGGTATYTVQIGTYTKIGRFIYASAMITVNTLGTGSNREIQGLPFNINQNNNDIGATIGYVINCASSFVYISAGNYINSIILGCKLAASTESGFAAVFQNGTAVRVTFTYFT